MPTSISIGGTFAFNLNLEKTFPRVVFVQPKKPKYNLFGSNDIKQLGKIQVAS